ncbi:MAG TPA: NAD(P)/FAD-dependent oxidoreductase [Puia sp.]
MQTAIIIGAGPAGLTAAYELLTRTDIIPVVIEADKQVGGLSKTIHFKGNRIDIGGHRFFSKSQKVVDWWLHFLPLASAQAGELPEHAVNEDRFMLLRSRRSRIYYKRNFFDYPLQISRAMIRRLGRWKMVRIGLSYLRAKAFPIRREDNLEQFFINRFGRELYRTFFSEYTEKVWGVPCNQIPASWGRQRIKDLDIVRLLRHWLKNLFRRDTSVHQKNTSTSLIEQFLYPKFGPGQMWETVAEEVTRRGGRIMLHTAVTSLTGDGASKLTAVGVKDLITGENMTIQGEYFISTMPVKELILDLRSIPVPAEVRQISEGLQYRDFLIVGILLCRLSLEDKDNAPIRDNWIYIQDNGIKAGRLQFFHNWSPFMVARPENSWLGVEYFCNESDELWQRGDEEIKAFALAEMESIGILSKEDVKDAVVVKVKKAYPSYYGKYDQFQVVRDFLEKIINLYPVGRNGMHRYNNSDHSMLTAMAAVDNIGSGRTDKSNIWDINTEDSYHEETDKQP